MKHNFNIENYKGKYVMHCKTEEEAKEFCEYLDNIGRRWVTGRRYTDPAIVWTVDDCYYFNEGQKSVIGFAKTSDYTILEWADFVVFTKSDLKDGMVVRLRNDNRYLACNNTLMGQNSCMDLKSFNDELECLGDNEFDIVGVYKTDGHQFNNVFFNTNLTLIWARKEEPKYKEMTIEEIEKELGYKVKVIADKE